MPNNRGSTGTLLHSVVECSSCPVDPQWGSQVVTNPLINPSSWTIDLLTVYVKLLNFFKTIFCMDNLPAIHSGSNNGGFTALCLFYPLSTKVEGGIGMLHTVCPSLRPSIHPSLLQICVDGGYGLLADCLFIFLMHKWGRMQQLSSSTVKLSALWSSPTDWLIPIIRPLTGLLLRYWFF